jgi:serine/threonine protein kinase
MGTGSSSKGRAWVQGRVHACMHVRVPSAMLRVARCLIHSLQSTAHSFWTLAALLTCSGHCTSPAGRVYLVDFGGVQGQALAAGSLGSTVVGTYGYMAPEQFRGAAAPASDLYALGGTLLYLVSGQPPAAFPQQGMSVVWQDKVTAGPVLQQVRGAAVAVMGVGL